MEGVEIDGAEVPAHLTRPPAGQATNAGSAATMAKPAASAGTGTWRRVQFRPESRVVWKPVQGAFACNRNRHSAAFLDPDDGRGRVLYRRYDGNYGLISPS